MVESSNNAILNDRIPIASPKIPSADDWSGLSSAAERRRRQNRVNQRAHRCRKQVLLNLQEQRVDPGVLRYVSFNPQTFTVYASQNGPPQQSQDTPVAISLASQSELVPRIGIQPDPGSSLSLQSTSPLTETALLMEIPSPEKKALLKEWLRTFHQSYTTGCPTSDHLLGLTRVNVFRAFVNNMMTLSLNWEWMNDDSISPFPMMRPGTDIVDLPVSLRPTVLQKTCIHHTWIDFFPSPVMRDNLLRAGNDWDDEELCDDIMGYWEGNTTGPYGLVVWGEPSDPCNWEVTEGFLKKWGWIIRGCHQIMQATNHWREKRGERPLFSSRSLN